MRGREMFGMWIAVREKGLGDIRSATVPALVAAATQYLLMLIALAARRDRLLTILVLEAWISTGFFVHFLPCSKSLCMARKSPNPDLAAPDVSPAQPPVINSHRHHLSYSRPVITHIPSSLCLCCLDQVTSSSKPKPYIYTPPHLEG